MSDKIIRPMSKTKMIQYLNNEIEYLKDEAGRYEKLYRLSCLAHELKSMGVSDGCIKARARELATGQSKVPTTNCHADRRAKCRYSGTKLCIGYSQL